jgi:SAM-dependent methyltransferase
MSTWSDWQATSRAFWREGYKQQGGLNTPETYWADGSDCASFTTELLEILGTMYMRPEVDGAFENGPASVLELGCNAGRNLAAIAHRFSGVKLAGVDINPEALAFADEHLAGYYRTLCVADIAKDFGDDFGGLVFPVDLVFSMYVIAHIQPQLRQGVLDRARAISKRVIFIEPHVEGYRPEELPVPPFSKTTGAPTMADDYTRYNPTPEVVIPLPVKIDPNKKALSLMYASAVVWKGER